MGLGRICNTHCCYPATVVTQTCLNSILLYSPCLVYLVSVVWCIPIPFFGHWTSLLVTVNCSLNLSPCYSQWPGIWMKMMVPYSIVQYIAWWGSMMPCNNQYFYQIIRLNCPWHASSGCAGQEMSTRANQWSLFEPHDPLHTNSV